MGKVFGKCHEKAGMRVISKYTGMQTEEKTERQLMHLVCVGKKQPGLSDHLVLTPRSLCSND